MHTDKRTDIEADVRQTDGQPDRRADAPRQKIEIELTISSGDYMLTLGPPVLALTL